MLPVPTVTCLYLSPSAVFAPVVKVWVSEIRAYMYCDLQPFYSVTYTHTY